MTTFVLSRINAGFVTFSMTIAALKTNAAVLWVFGALTATCVLLVLAEFGIATSSLVPIAGCAGITCGVSAWYAAFAHVTHATYGRELIPAWPWA